jgi:hypothetical protein
MTELPELRGDCWQDRCGVALGRLLYLELAEVDLNLLFSKSLLLTES